MKMINSNEVYTKQIDAYRLIYDKALTTKQKGLSMYDKLSDYNGLTNIKYNLDIEDRKKEFHELEGEIFNVKQDSIDSQARLDELRVNIKLADAAVKEQIRRNFHMNNNNIASKYKYFVIIIVKIS